MKYTEKSVSVVDARTNLSELLGEVFYARQPIVIKRHGKPMAVLIHPEDFVRFHAWREEHGGAQERSAVPTVADGA